MRFSDLLRAANEPVLEDFHCWVFRAGMLFNAPNKWWGDLGRRDFPHEGVDFCLYENTSGKICRLNHQTRIPVLYDGVVRQIFPDYLGQAVVVEHQTTANGKSKTLSIYAHTLPTKRLHAGVRVTQGDIIATIAETSQRKTPIFPHLHYTLGRTSLALGDGKFVWNDMRDPNRVELLNPLSVIQDRYL